MRLYFNGYIEIPDVDHDAARKLSLGITGAFSGQYQGYSLHCTDRQPTPPTLWQRICNVFNYRLD